MTGEQQWFQYMLSMEQNTQNPKIMQLLQRDALHLLLPNTIKNPSKK